MNSASGKLRRQKDLEGMLLWLRPRPFYSNMQNLKDYILSFNKNTNICLGYLGIFLFSWQKKNICNWWKSFQRKKKKMFKKVITVLLENVSVNIILEFLCFFEQQNYVPVPLPLFFILMYFFQFPSLTFLSWTHSPKMKIWVEKRKIPRQKKKKVRKAKEIFF